MPTLTRKALKLSTVSLSIAAVAAGALAPAAGAVTSGTSASVPPACLPVGLGICIPLSAFPKTPPPPPVPPGFTYPYALTWVNGQTIALNVQYPVGPSGTPPPSSCSNGLAALAGAC